jgi:GAF domain-containing protein
MLEQAEPGGLERRVSELQRDKEVLLDRLQADRARIAALQKALDMVNDLKNVQRVLDSALQGAMELTGAEAGSILLANKEDPNVLEFVSVKGKKAAELVGRTIRLGEGIAGWVAEQGIAQIVPDAAKDDRFQASLADQIDYPVNNVLCVPLRKAGALVGVLELLNKAAGRGFIALDVDMAETIASQAGRLMHVAENLAVGAD